MDPEAADAPDGRGPKRGHPWRAEMKKVVSGGPAHAIALPQADAGLPDTISLNCAARAPMEFQSRVELPDGRCAASRRK
jgi:hypothetical protein